jgi:hypothetical protein
MAMELFQLVGMTRMNREKMGGRMLFLTGPLLSMFPINLCIQRKRRIKKGKSLESQCFL